MKLSENNHWLQETTDTEASDREITFTLAEVAESLKKGSMVSFFVRKLAKRINQSIQVDPILLPPIIEVLSLLDPKSHAFQELRQAAAEYITHGDLINYYTQKDANPDNSCLIPLSQIGDPEALKEIAIHIGFTKLSNLQIKIIRGHFPELEGKCLKELVLRKLKAVSQIEESTIDNAQSESLPLAA